MNKAFAGAKRRGAYARRADKPINACPYQDKRTHDGTNSVTFSRAFRVFWKDGWEEEDRAIKAMKEERKWMHKE